MPDPGSAWIESFRKLELGSLHDEFAVEVGDVDLREVTRTQLAVTLPEANYSHRRRPGDELIWDQRATLLPGTPWPFEAECTHASFVTSACERDGVDSARP